jgi:tetratricopeptide (TPR) repeat protein
VLVLLLLVLAATGAVVVWVWFAHHLRLARTELAKGHNAAAIAHLHKCEAISSENREVMILSARAARRAGAWDEAEAILTRYWELHGDEEALVLERLLLRAARGEVEAVGEAVMARIRDDGPDSALAREAFITGLLYRYLWTGAIRQLDDWLARDPDSTAALLLRGKLEEQRLQFAPAVATYRRIIELDPEHDEARLRLSTLLLANRLGTEALEHLTELRKRLADHPEVQLQWAKALALEGRTNESRAALDACLRDHPDYPAALAEHGALLLLDGEEKSAEKELARAVALDPGNLTIRNQYTLALNRNGKRAEARAEEKAIEALKLDLERITTLVNKLQDNPNDPAIPFEIAQIARRSGQKREALRWFNTALQVDPKYAPAHQELATLYAELDNPILAGRHRAFGQQGAASPRP